MIRVKARSGSRNVCGCKMEKALLIVSCKVFLYAPMLLKWAGSLFYDRMSKSVPFLQSVRI